MVIVIKTGTPEAAIRQLLAQLAAQNVKGGCVAGPNGILLPLVGDTWRLDPNMLQGLPYVQEVRRLTPAYRLAGRAAHPANTVVAVGDAKIGEKFCMIAGPCAVESAPQMAAVAQSVKESGAQLLRGGAFKPRTSPYTFQGLEKAGLDLLVQAGRDAGLPVVTEITDISQLDLLADVDVLQVGARNMQNYTLLKALGQLRRPVLLKRGLSATVEEFLLAAEYLLSGGNEQVILCERGVRSGVSAARAALDVSAIPVLKRATHLPVLVDPSHAAGRSELVLPLALAAAAAGADGLMVEVHDRPACALSDGGQSLTCRQFRELSAAVTALLPYAWRPDTFLAQSTPSGDVPFAEGRHTKAAYTKTTTIHLRGNRPTICSDPAPSPASSASGTRRRPVRKRCKPASRGKWRPAVQPQLLLRR